GKSTLAHALTDAGARLVTDDALPVQIGRPPMLRPGIHQVRLRRDSASRLIYGEVPPPAGYAGKHVVTDLPEDRLVLETIPLSAIYLLSPVRPDGNPPAAQRDELPSMAATLALVRQTKGGCLLGRTESAVVLERAADLARTAPVYRLRVVRDFDRLEEVVEQLFDWHGRPASQSALAGV
ncbi:MAG TPA: hypothetical protein VGR27_07170, partial [Longimicrobiaceae bacterium]|nr:hypothetical protein [Longimicrobiaceae bacterium]